MATRVGDFVKARGIYRPREDEGIKIYSIYEVAHWRRGVLLSRTWDHNLVTNEGLDAWLDIMLHAATQITTWYVGLVESNTTPAAAMTYAVPTFTESSAYSEGTRQEYVEAAASSQSTTNSASKATFSINATKTIYGAALFGGGSAATTKGDVAGGGTLLNYSKFSASKSVVSGDSVEVTVTFNMADA
jgi:hypothetical protein